MVQVNELQEKPYEEVLLGRQPIYNSSMGVFAYELLFRAKDKTIAHVDADIATTEVLMNAFLAMDIQELVGTTKVALNISEYYLHKADKLPLPQEKVILDVPANLTITNEIVAIFKQLKKIGFTLALEGNIVVEALKPLLPYVDILKIDVTKILPDDIQGYLKALKKYKHISLLALKVESLEEYRFYRDHGFAYCQGNLLSKPRVYSAKSLSSNKAVLMSLLSALYKPNFDFNEVEKAISQDISVGYKLLKLINSAFFGLPREIESLQQAAVLLGRDQLRSWISMLAMRSMGDCPKSLMEIAVIRAKMCELLAKSAGYKGVDSYFTVGLFSALDVLMKHPLPNLIAKLPFSDEVKQAILSCKGEMGQALSCVLAYENSDWDNIQFAGLEQNEISKAGAKAFIWSGELIGQI